MNKIKTSSAEEQFMLAYLDEYGQEEIDWREWKIKLLVWVSRRLSPSTHLTLPEKLGVCTPYTVSQVEEIQRGYMNKIGKDTNWVEYPLCLQLPFSTIFFYNISKTKLQQNIFRFIYGRNLK